MLNFSEALHLLKQGARVSRSGWNGKGMYIYLVPGSTFQTNRPPLTTFLGEGVNVTYLPHLDMRTANGEFVPWLASQTDILADDWQIVS